MRNLRPLRRASLRSVLLLLVLCFVAVPLIVYHFFTFDFQRVASLERRVRSAFPSTASLPPCLGVSSQEFLASDALQKLQTLCGAQNTRNRSSITSNLRLVHFVNVAVDAVPPLPGEQAVDREQFTYLQFAALQAARRALRPDMMMLHYLETPRGVWFTQCQRHLGLHQVLPPVSFDAIQPPLSRQERRRIIEMLVLLRALKKHGGVAFSDFNTVLMRATRVDMDTDLVVAAQSHRSKTFGLALHMMQAPPGHPFVEFLEHKIVEMVEANDPKLHRLPLDEVVGQIVLQKYQEERGDQVGGGGNGTLGGRSSIMDGVTIGLSKLLEFDALHELLTAKMGPALTGKFRGVAGFHVDRYDFAEQSADTEDLREIARMQTELTLADEWQNLDTLLGAVVRLAVSANTSAELEPLFT
ncbi:uncharacterized protein KRP23_32 [Phytophthora ramorum]|uniref:uncharacterized protein n=1 Tax=Phytophthora ramorum TaxID=164328 RepID=UPI0030B5F566|nr:hypothetical protein KRP23_32 [Phytophthora ramorum]